MDAVSSSSSSSNNREREREREREKRERGTVSLVTTMASLFRACVNWFTQANDAAVAAVEGAGLKMGMVRFATGLLAMVPTNFVAGLMPKGNARHIFGTVSTLGLLTLAYGRDVEQFVYAGALVYLFMRFFPKRCGYLTWGTIFTYQIYLHYERSSEAAWNSGDIDFTGTCVTQKQTLSHWPGQRS